MVTRKEISDVIKNRKANRCELLANPKLNQKEKFHESNYTNKL